MKLGGSVITKKERLLTPNHRVISRLAEEIKRADVKPLIIIHGGGSFGHPIAKKYKITDGYSYSKQLIGFSKTHLAMMFLNRLVIDAFIQRDIPAMALQPSAFIVTRKGRILNFNKAFIIRMLDMNLVPVLYGDVVLDEEQGFSVLSGDQLIAVIAITLGLKRIILCVDVDGLYTDDPKLNSNAQLIKEISLDELKSLSAKIGVSANVDVTGGMCRKITELIPALEKGIKIEIINAKKTNRLYKALMSYDVKGTKIEHIG